MNKPNTPTFEQGQDMTPDAKPEDGVSYQSPACCPCCHGTVMLGHWLSNGMKMFNCQCGAHWGVSGSWSPETKTAARSALFCRYFAR